METGLPPLERPPALWSFLQPRGLLFTCACCGFLRRGGQVLGPFHSLGPMHHC